MLSGFGVGISGGAFADRIVGVMRSFGVDTRVVGWVLLLPRGVVGELEIYFLWGKTWGVSGARDDVGCVDWLMFGVLVLWLC